MFFLLMTSSKLKLMRKIDTFIHTYMRCFDSHDLQRLSRRNNISKFTSTFLGGPCALLLSISLPYNVIYTEFSEIALIWQSPAYVCSFLLFRAASKMIWLQLSYSFKYRMYMKYSKEMDLTKEQIEELEAEEDLIKKIN